jgi:hypothetical protein
LDVSLDFFPFDVTPFAPRKIRVVAEFKPRKINLVLRRFRKVDFGKSYWQGTVRAFMRVDSYYGSGGNSATGCLGSLSSTFNTTAGTSSTRESTIVTKAFIHFAGMTAGRAQSMYAFNYDSLRGSNATTSLIAYTTTFGSGFSATLSAEEQASRRTVIGSTIAGPANAAGTAVVPATINGITAASFLGQPAGARIPDVVGNIRYEAPWGVAQLSAAAHQNSASLFGSSALGTPATTPTLPLTPGYAFPAATSNNYGFAVQAGLQFKMDFLSPGDRFWLQAAYEKGAFGYIAGNNLGFNYGAINQNRSAGSGFTPEDYSFGWNPLAKPNNSNPARTPTSIPRRSRFPTMFVPPQWQGKASKWRPSCTNSWTYMPEISDVAPSSAPTK